MTLRDDRRAVLRGMRAASRLHRDFDTPNRLGDSMRIDVFDAIVRSGATLMFKPLDKLLGAFLREGAAKGIIITTRRPIGVQRFTAGHELGHMDMIHEPHADDENILRRAPIAGTYRNVPIQEREADAFASHFVLPRFLIEKYHHVHELLRRDYDNPQIVYQASLRFGASYAATLFAFEREKLISRSMRDEMRKIQPKELKRDLIDELQVDNWSDRDVWHLTEKDEGLVIEANRNDIFALKLNEHKGSGYLWTFDELQEAGFVILKDESEALYADRLGGPNSRYVIGDPSLLPDGCYTMRETRPFDPEDDVRSLTVYFRNVCSKDPGLYAPQLDSLMRVQ